MTIEELLESWDGLAVVTRRDPETGSWIFIALHDDTLGTPVGGTRMKVYESPAQALRDAQRLAEGMTSKWAAVEIDNGGGKAVIAPPGPLGSEQRHGLLRRYGQLLESLNGSFGTGQDLGMTPADMLVIAGESSRVHGCILDRGVALDAGPYTARGVAAGMLAAVRHVGERESLDGCRVHVEGIGDVGEPLARQLVANGARLVISDLDSERCGRLAEEIGAEVADLDASPACDVYAPCAVGATLNAESIPRLRCRIVAGSANNQLAEPEDALRLRERGILYAPDYVVNAGGAIAFGLLHRGVPEADAITRIDGIGGALEQIFRVADENGESPVAGAARHVEAVLARARRR